MPFARTVFLIACALPMAGAASAEGRHSHQDQIDLVAGAVTSAVTCSKIGYDVDMQGIRSFKKEVRTAALAEGAEMAAFDRAQDEAIKREYAELRRRHYYMRPAMPDSDGRFRYKSFWAKRCSDLSRDEATASLYHAASD